MPGPLHLSGPAPARRPAPGTPRVPPPGAAPAARSGGRSSLWLAVGLAALVIAGGAFGLYLWWKRGPAETPAEAACKRGAQELLTSLGEPVRVTFYVSRGGLPKVDAFADGVDRIMRDYQDRSGGKLVYSTIAVTTEAHREAARDAGLQEAALGDVNDGGSALLMRGFIGITFHYRGEKEAIPMLSPDQTQGLPFWITNKIRELRDRADHRMHAFALITGKDEIKISDPNLIAAGAGPGPNLRGILEQNFPFYSFKDLDLQGGEAEIPREYAGVIVTQPGKPYDEKELRRIDDFLMLGGKSAMIFAGAVNLKPSDSTMAATLDTRGLERLLDGYGIEMMREAVYDWGQSLTIPLATTTGVVQLTSPGIVIAKHDAALGPEAQTLDSTFTGFFRLDQLVFPFPSTLAVHPAKQPDAKIRVVARTTPQATVDRGESISMRLDADRAPAGPAAPRAIAVVVEGTVTSAFGGKKAPGRVLVISASQFLANPFARSGNPPPAPPQMAMLGATGGDEQLKMLAGPYAQSHLTSTILAFKNTLDWAIAEDDLVACAAALAEKKSPE
jgi:ABC-type uncharacterized transport system